MESVGMLWLLLGLLPLVGCSRVLSQDALYLERQGHDGVAVAARPHIDRCRSPNMEDFTCWWHPLENMSDQEVTYILTYSKDKGPKHNCPDYTTGGPHSCHFDSSHTSIWRIYCMNVTAITAQGNFTSQEHCLDVAEIVETEAPVNLTYMLTDAGGDEMGHNALLSWTYPVPSDLQFGWITLEYELQYRRVTEPDNWKVKQPLRESHVELLGLPVGDYVVRVRCRSRNYGLWSKWSSALLMSIPTRPPAGKLLVLILVTGVGVVALLVIGFGVIPQSKRIKSYFLPPIPKPRIIGIDSLLLKKGHMDEINRHFSNFHSYSPPRYTEEVWDQVSSDDSCLALPRDCNVPAEPPDRERDALMIPCNRNPVAATHHQLTSPNPIESYVQNPAAYISSPLKVIAPAVPDVPTPWPWPGIVSLPGTDYSMMGHPVQPVGAPTPEAAALTAGRPPQDFYTCVQLMNESGEVHLVPCLAPTAQGVPARPGEEPDGGDREEKKKQLADYQAKTNALPGRDGGGEVERSDAAVPLLPVAVDNKG